MFCEAFIMRDARLEHCAEFGRDSLLHELLHTLKTEQFDVLAGTWMVRDPLPPAAPVMARKRLIALGRHHKGSLLPSGCRKWK